jgi:hypothetical protein
MGMHNALPGGQIIKRCSLLMAPLLILKLCTAQIMLFFIGHMIEAI